MATQIGRTWYNTLVDDDGSGLVGSSWDKADVDSLLDAVDAMIAADIQFGGTIKERNRSVAMGEWTSRAFSASNFNVNGSLTMTLTSGQVPIDRHMLIGKTLFWNLAVENFTVGGSGTGSITVALPGGVQAALSTSLPGVTTNGLNAEAWHPGLISTSNGGSAVSIVPMPAFTVTPGSTKYIYLNAVIPIL